MGGKAAAVFAVMAGCAGSASVQISSFDGVARDAAAEAQNADETGGVSDKVLPALSRGIHVIAIRRPQEENTCEENR